ncbi:MAG: hypothetical protein HOW97_06940 [Catenulispora sp.]|nr:hypothetical protein [Catenulispora sp.]
MAGAALATAALALLAPGTTMEVGGSDSRGAAYGNLRHAGTVTGTVNLAPTGRLIQDANAVDAYTGLRS